VTRLEIAQAYLIDAGNNEVTLQDLERASCLSRFHLIRSFTCVYGAPPLEHCHTDLRYLNQVLGWQGDWPSQWQAVVKAGPGQADQAIVRWSGASLALTSAIDKLRMGISRHETAPRIVALRVHQQVQIL
jgi:hypothetical protein